MAGVNLLIWSGTVADHECLHEVDLALVQNDTKEIRKGVDRLVKIIEGNGENGLVTKITVAEKSLTRAWWAIGLILTGIGGIVGILLTC